VSDVVIIGAGPYGLAAAAHLRTIRGLEVRVFGEPMSFWDSNMPAGMLLRSNWTATQIANPTGALSLEAYLNGSGERFSTPVPLEGFIRYGKWYQRQAVPDLEPRRVMSVAAEPAGFRIQLDHGELAASRRLIVAAGIGPFAWRPPEFEGLPQSLVSHSSEWRNMGAFSGKTVLVVGSGQSALESAALIGESGGSAEVIGRSPRIHWLQGRLSKTLHHRLGSAVRSLLYAPTDVGPAGVSQLMARPDLMRHLPRALQDRLRKRCVRPAGARWLVERLRGIPIRTGTRITTASASGERIKVRLDDGTERNVDHVLLGTGYRVDISRYDFLEPGIVQRIERANGYPRLREGLESSLPGLHFLGAPAAWSFGPLMQFVSGTHYASRALARSIAIGSSVR
jgi:cation diffusion facilitator CzcD-associated flavoprotein CzcO